METHAQFVLAGVESGDHAVHDVPGFGNRGLIEVDGGEANRSGLEKNTRPITVGNIFGRDLGNACASVGKGLDETLGFELPNRLTNRNERHTVGRRQLLEPQVRTSPR